MKKLLLFIILNLAFLSFPEDISDKTTLFSYNIFSENDLYLALEGSWKFDISTFASGNISSAFENFVFNQEPDIEASLWLFNKYFFETKITDESDENIFILGYQNTPGFLQEVRIGNDDLNIESYADYTPSVNSENSPGARIKLGTNNSQHELLGRYTNEENNTVKYKGYYSIEEESLTINQYEKERFFILPFNDFDDLEIYSLDDDTLTELSNSDYIFTSSENLLYLEEEEDGNSIYLSIGNRKQADYEDLLFSFIDPDNNPGIDSDITSDELWDKYIVDPIGNGNKYIKLTNTGYSPFDQMGSYDLETLSSLDEDDLEIYLNDEQIINYSIYDDYIIIKDTSLNYTDLEKRYPFYDEDKEIYSSGGSGLTSEYTLDFQILTAVSEITVPDEAKENSLDITINGVSYTDFTHDSDSGVVTFNKEISIFDEIIINYKTEVTSGTGNLLLSYGSRYQINENLTFDLSLTSSWDFSSDDYSYETNENIGAITSRGLLDYETEKLSIELSSTLFASTPDTTNGYMLFEYDQGEIDLPVSSVELSQDSSGVSFIKRDYNDLLLTYNEIYDLDEDSSGGPYTVYNTESDENDEVIVLETSDLETDDYSIAYIDLDDYSDDYSWATSFSVDIMSSKSNRDLIFTFKDEDESDDTTLILSKELTTDSEFETYTFLFSESERAKLTNLDIITIKIGEGDADLFLLKNLTFKGDSLVTHNSSTEDFYVTTSDSSMGIATTSSDAEGESIEISSSISTVNINSYEKMGFTIDTTGILENSEITLELKNSGDTISKLYIPNGLEDGENSIIVYTQSEKVTINGATVDGVTWSSSDVEVDSFTLTFDNCSEGALTLSEIILSEPIWEFYNQSSLNLEYRPELSIIVDDFPIVDNIVLSTEGNFINNGDPDFNLTGGVDMDLVGTSISTSVYYDDSLERLEYKVIVPSFDSPITLTDQFSYDSDRYRFESIDFKINTLTLSIDSSDTLGEDSGVRSSNVVFNTESKYLFSIGSETSLQQERSESVQDMNSEISSSYISLIPENIIDTENNLSQELDLKLNTKQFNIIFSVNGALNQEKSSDNSDTNTYGMEVQSDITMESITLSPTISSEYEYINNDSSIENLTDGIYEYLYLFQETNPYGDINIYDLFLSKNRTKFYDTINTDIDRTLDSELSLKITHDIPLSNQLNIIIPKALTLSINKDLSKEESQYTSTLTNSLKFDFTSHPEIKNSITLTQQYDIEESETTNGLDWDLLLFKELKDDVSLDISNSLTLSDDESTNILSAELNWLGESGPLLILPLFDKVLDSPYHYDHTEEFYLSLTDDSSDFVIGLKHQTILTVNDINETQFYVDLGWDNDDDDKLSLEIGLYTTLIF